MNENKRDIRKLSIVELSEFLTEHNEKSFRAKQIMQWIWEKGVTDFGAMNNISLSVRGLLSEYFYFATIEQDCVQEATDGTLKTAWRLSDGLVTESVLIPGGDRWTVCVSSQVGCKLGCRFCATGGMGFKRDLTSGEIFDQIIAARAGAEARGSSLSNIVFMGMGEPMLNYDNLMEAISHITDEKGLGMSPYRITVSTAGIPDGIRRLADGGVRFNLAVSLHSAKNSVRSSLMPVNNAYPLEKVAEALRYFVEKTQTRPTFEYLLLSGVNDSLDDAKALAEYCKQFPIKINVIEYNSTDGSEFSRSSERQRDAFVAFLEQRNMIVNVRRSKGMDIAAACGQLANKRVK